MNDQSAAGGPESAPTGRTAAYRLGRSMLGTVPIVLASSMAMSLNVTGSVFAADHAHPDLKRPGVSPDTDDAARIDLSAFGVPSKAPATQPEIELTAATVRSAPSSYVVVAGDTVSSIAGRFGLSTASVLALNGLSWKSTIYPGQHLSLSAAKVTPTHPAAAAPAPARTTASAYTVVRGDTLSAIAAKHGVSTQALLSANGLGLSSIIYPGQKITIPATGAAKPAQPSSAATHTSATTSAGATGATKYTIKKGDTLSSIAKAHSTTVDRLLTANGLSWTSMIYAGKTLTIPATSKATATITAAAATTAAVPSSSLDSVQQANARTIIRVGHSLGVSDYGIVVALAAAAQESGLENLPSGDSDSVGLFQQRPSQGWGTRAQLSDTTYAARLFFGGSRNPNAGKTRGLLDIRGWSTMTVTQAAQAVQRSAYPDAYAKWESSARVWLRTL